MNEIIQALQDALKNISELELAAAVAAIPLVTKGITNKFKIDDGNLKELTSLAVAIGAFCYLLFRDYVIIQVIATFVIIYAGGTGIYNFLPQSVKNQEYIVSDEVIELDIDDEQLEKELEGK